MNVDQLIERLRGEIKDREAKIAALVEIGPKLAGVDLPNGSWCGMMLDFDRLPHADVIKVIRAFGGKWTKKPSSGETDKIDYVATIGPLTVRCWQGSPPPSCKIIEVEEFVPEQIIPAKTVKKLKMVCHPELSAKIATARENNPEQVAIENEG